MEPKIVELAPMLVVGLEYVGKNEHGEIPALWEALPGRCAEITHVVNAYTLGVCSELRADGAFSYVAGFEVDSAEDIPQGMVAKQLPAARYAVFTHHGPLFGGEHDLGATYADIYRDWLPKSGYQHAASPEFERYDERFAFGQAQSEMEIYIPIM